MRYTDICQDLHGSGNRVCPDGMPPFKPLWLNRNKSSPLPNSLLPYTFSGIFGGMPLNESVFWPRVKADTDVFAHSETHISQMHFSLCAEHLNINNNHKGPVAVSYHFYPKKCGQIHPNIMTHP